ncbi:polysaccharide biosynthesis protein [Natranaerobius thermophilus JW/NM-WN-LF]|uniref:Polysaccharide biosynthesis protein n=2 Tax=Natranaerobius TaxID=375928 RepID=B2A8K9_NATTJ|nr:polysaccharide biosynthesis protein [Natranaerobius thermophilus JW/NM-WN-LF]
MAERLAKGAAILMAAGVVSKLLGAFYRIPLSRIIEAEGMGLYEMAYPIYSLLLIMAVSGVPIAVSKLVSEQIAQGKEKERLRVFAVSLVFLFITGSFFSGLMYFLAEPISYGFLGDYRVIYSLRAISPAILIVSLMAAFRGYFQGLRIMSATAISQVTEQFVRVITMLALAYVLVERGIAYGAAGATFGAVTGGLSGLIIMLLLIPLYGVGPGLLNFFKAILSTLNLVRSVPLVIRLLSIAIPVSLGALVMPVMQTLDAMIIPQRLQVAGFSPSEATHLYGYLSGMALRLVSLPTTLSLALGYSLVPALAESTALKKFDLVRSQLGKAIRLTFIFSIPSSVGLFVMAERLTLLLFGYEGAGDPLRFLAAGTIFLSFQQVSASALQGTGYPVLPVKNLCYGALVNLVINYYLTAIPQIGIIGGAIGTCTGFLVASIFNFKDIKGKIGLSNTQLGLIRKPLLSAVAMGAIITYFQPILDNLAPNFSVGTVMGMALGAVSYGIILITCGGISTDDLESIPKIGPGIAGFIKKIGLGS